MITLTTRRNHLAAARFLALAADARRAALENGADREIAALHADQARRMRARAAAARNGAPTPENTITTHDQLYAAWNEEFRSVPVSDPRYATGDAVYHTLENARQNAQHTVAVEHAAPANEFDRLMIGGIEDALACRPASVEVLQWFAAHGITG